MITSEFLGVTGKGRVEFSEALEVAQTIIKQYTEDKEIDKVFLVYNEFKSVLSQRVVLEQLLPISHAKQKKRKQSNRQIWLITFTSNPRRNVQHASAASRRTQIFRALLESVASEQARA